MSSVRTPIAVFAALAVAEVGVDETSATRASRVESSAPEPKKLARTKLGHEGFGHEGCRWHDGGQMNSVEWWWAEYRVDPRIAPPTAGQRARIETLLRSIESEMADADAAKESALGAALPEITRRYEADHPARDRFSDAAIVARTLDSARDRLARLDEFDDDGNLMEVDSFSRPPKILAHVERGDYPAFDAALDLDAKVHDSAPSRVRELIRSIR